MVKMTKSFLKKWCLSVTLLIALHIHSGWCVECYVCSYSPLSNGSRLDGCTDKNFKAEFIDARTCEMGCEAVSVFDANGNLESFHRNCAHASSSVVNDCLTSNTVLVSRTVCACDWDYCNSSHRSSSSSWLCVLTTTMTLLTTKGSISGWFQPSGS